jgi:outer membrane receptor protein involved in Fe transport
VRTAPVRMASTVLSMAWLVSVSAALPVGAETTQVAQAASPEGAEASPPEQSAPTRREREYDDIEEIVVHGGESEAVVDLQAADSVTGFSASDLEALGAQSVADLAAFTPNLEIVTSGATTPTFFIRGVGLNDFNANSTGAVSIYQDDVQKNSPALQLASLYDMEAVNILRGPQGTGPARNASAGAIKLYSAKPTPEFSAFLRSTFGNYDARDFEGAVNAPLFEDILSSRFAFRFSERQGYVHNRCGDAPPDSRRGVRLPGNPENDPGPDANGLPISLCGESVDPFRPFVADGKSDLPEGLATNLNNLNNWSARGTLRFQPTLDQEWMLSAQGSKRDEHSRVGESYGTSGRSFVPDCDEGLPPSQRRSECRVRGTLGGPDRGGYQAPEVVARINDLDPCTNPDGSQTGFCDNLNGIAQGDLRNRAKVQVSDELARHLDTNPWDGSYNSTGPTKNDVWGTSLKGDIALGRSLFLTTVSGYDTYDRIVDLDLDFSPNQLFEVRTEDEGYQFVQDMHLAGSLPNQPVNWKVGVYYLQEKLEVNINNRFLPEVEVFGVSGRDYTQKLWSAAGWMSFDWSFWEDFTLDGGFRYNYDRKEMDYLLGQGDPRNPVLLTDRPKDDWNAPTGTIRLTYRFREDTHAFWKYTRGWKGGHFNATSSEDGVTTADPETIDSFETGLRGSWFDGKLGLDMSFFYYRYSDYQIFTIEQKLSGQPEFVIINASDAEVYGGEADIVARPLPGMFLQVRASWLESQFLDFVQNQVSSEPSPQDPLESQIFDIEIQNTGNQLLNSPKFKVSITAEQALPLGRFGTLTARYDGAWTDNTYFDATEGRGVPNAAGEQFLPEDTIGQKAYWLHNLRLAYRVPDGSVELAGWIRNLDDKVYKTFGFDASTFNNTTIYFVGEPRTYGASLMVSF